jgi:HAD superfamily hydrolase (TIGR01509 family)
MNANPPSATIEAIIFDLDGLLVDTEPLTDEALSSLLQQHDCEIAWTPELVARLMGRRIIEVLAEIAGICGLAVPAQALNEALEERRLVVMQGRLHPLPGAVDLIAFGREAGLRLALATSGRRSYVDAVLAESRLTGCFEIEITGEDITHGKPAPDGYLLAASRLEVMPANCVVFEDAPAGIASAVAAGARAVAVPNHYTRELDFAVAPEAVLPDLHAAIPWLEARGCPVSRMAPMSTA